MVVGWVALRKGTFVQGLQVEWAAKVVSGSLLEALIEDLSTLSLVPMPLLKTLRASRVDQGSTR